MRISTICFDLAIGTEYFPGVKVTKPFYCTVSYEFNDVTNKHKLLSVQFVGNTLEYFRNNGNFCQDIDNAIVNNIESRANMSEEIKAISDEAWENYRDAINY